MFKQNYKVLIIGLIIGLLFSNLLVFAESATKQINAVYNNIKIVVDGATVEPKDASGKVVEPFIVDGTTYLPVRSVAEALGKPVQWDGSTQTVYIGERPGAAQYMVDICPAYQSGGGYIEYSAKNSGGVDKFNMGGVTYTNGLLFRNNSAWAVYNLNSQYKSFTGILCHIDGTANGKGTMRIFFDSVIQKEIEISSDMIPLSLDFNVSGVIQVKIEMETSGINGWPSYGIGDPILK